MAVNPQITKLYALNNLEDMHKLLFRSSKFACYLMLIFTIPIVMETETIIKLWLKIVPEYTVPFLRILLVIVIIDSMARPLMTAAAATGDVKKYQSVIGGILLAIVPIAYVVLKLGGNPTSVYIVHLSICIVAFIVRLFIIRPMIRMSLRRFFASVIAPCGLVTSCSFALSFAIKMVVTECILGTVLICVVSALLVVVIAYTIGLSKEEKSFVNAKVKDVLSKVNRHD